MLFNNFWTEGLTQKQQRLIVDYVLNGCVLKIGLGGYKSRSEAKRFIDSEKGRRAVRNYCNYFFDKKKDVVKLQLLKIYMKRAFFNPADIMDAHGRIIDEKGNPVKNLRELGDLAFCIDGIETKIHPGGIATIKTNLCDRDKAREFIVELFKILEDDGESFDLDYKPVYEMTDEERDQEIETFIKKGGFLPEPENGKKGKKK